MSIARRPLSWRRRRASLALLDRRRRPRRGARAAARRRRRRRCRAAASTAWHERRACVHPVVTSLSVPATAVPGRPPRVTLRIDEAHVGTVNATVAVNDLSTRKPAVVVRMGWVHTGRTLTVAWPRGARAAGRQLPRERERARPPAPQPAAQRAQLRREHADGRRAAAHAGAARPRRRPRRRSKPGVPTPGADGRRRRGLPGRRRAQLRRPRKPLRRPAQRPHPPGPGRAHRRRHARRRAAGGHDLQHQLPGRRRRLLRGRAHARSASTSCSPTARPARWPSAPGRP